MNKKIISLGLATVILGSSVSVFATDFKIDNHNNIKLAQAKYSKVSVMDKKLEAKNSTGDVSIVIPQFGGLTDQVFQNKLNKEIESKAEAKIAEYNKQVKESKDIKSAAKESTLKIDYEIKSNGYITSVIVTNYLIAPGQVNAEVTRDIYNVNTETNKVDKLNDLFKPNTNYKEVINKTIKNEINKNKDNYFTDENGFKSVDENTKFFITNAGDIVITFDLYEIAPRATGTPEFVIAGSEVKSILVKDKLMETVFTSKRMNPTTNQDVSILIPEINGLKDGVFEHNLNLKIRTDMDREFADFKIKSDSRKEGKSSFYVGYDVYLEDENTISFGISTYNYLAGDANGQTKVEYYNLDVKDFKFLELKDLFKANSNYKEIINKEIQDKINKDKDNYFTEENAFKSIKDNQKFHFDEKGNIVIVFDQYEIAPGSTGTPEFVIQKTLLNNVLK